MSDYDFGSEIARRLTLGQIDDEGVEALVQLYRDAIEEQAGRGEYIEAHRSALSRLADDPSLFESWFLIQSVTMFAHGAAVGAGRSYVEASDAQLARSGRCDKPYPACFESAVVAFDELLDWVRAFSEREYPPMAT